MAQCRWSLGLISWLGSQYSRLHDILLGDLPEKYLDWVRVCPLICVWQLILWYPSIIILSASSHWGNWRILLICRDLRWIDALCLGLANLVNLTRLSLSGKSIYRLCHPAKTFATLAKLSKLRHIELQDCKLHTSIYFSQWPSLEHLNLNSCLDCWHVVRPADDIWNCLFR